MLEMLTVYRHAARVKNLGGGHIVLGGDNVPPLVEIGLILSGPAFFFASVMDRGANFSPTPWYLKPSPSSH